MASPRSRLSALSEQQTLLSKRFETLMAAPTAGGRERHAQIYGECVARQEQQLASTRSALEALEATCMQAALAPVPAVYVPAVPMSLLPPEVLGSIAVLAGRASRLANSALRFAHDSCVTTLKNATLVGREQFRTLEQAVLRCPKLETIFVVSDWNGGAEWRDGAAAAEAADIAAVLVAAGARCTQLRSLRLGVCEASGVVAPALAQLTTLRSVTLCVGGDAAADDGVAIALALRSLCGLTELRVCQTTDAPVGAVDAMRALLTSLTTQSTLTLQSLAVVNLEYADFQTRLAPALRQMAQLRQLALHRCHISGSTIPALAEALGRQTSLQHLDLGNDPGWPEWESASNNRNSLDDFYVVPAVLPGLSAALAGLRDLRSLRLQSCGVDTGVASTLAVALRQLTRLTLLDLSGNRKLRYGLGDLPAALAAAQEGGGSPEEGGGGGELRELRLDDCELDGSSAVAIADVLPALARLERLWLLGNTLGGKGAAALTRAASDQGRVTIRMARAWVRLYPL